ncbi:hypothetical protein [Cupriavidus sp. TMH.W2]|uniref:hypothetical protein n=1 Tax=Cupriavidus sp. TMH.W2 TaxID=3434465 RepID=UPI003D76E65B
MNQELFVLTAWQQVLVIGAVALHAANSLGAEPAATPEQKFPPGYLESVATGYENGAATQAPAVDKTQATTPGTVTTTSLVAQPATSVSSPKEKKTRK